MRFVSPKIDFTFKKIFGSETSEPILISFLNAIIYGGEDTIKSLKIINPYNPGQISDFKETYLDVKATLADESIVVIEVQIGRMNGVPKLIMYNLAKAYANQVKTVEDCLKLKPAISVTIVDFVLFKESKKVITKFNFQQDEQEQEQPLKYPDEELQLFFVELPKFKKDLAELSSLSDKWIYFLKDAPSLETIPENLGEIEEIERALTIANQAGMTEEELEIADRRSIALQDEKGRIDYAREQGKEQGKEEGKKEGRRTEALSLVMVLVRQSFGDIPQAIASQIQDLNLEDLENLVKVFLSFKSLEEMSSWLQERR
ncbi:MAG: Rpn family recombination-promoting nuclease/putative transposase [Oscillatoria sp. SIO1A7]|nr:Rpn family recombination-promoting nuclease/putative transposase [Oscillatoria sp. SIO1A7]